MDTKIPIIVITRPKIKINFKCNYCSRQYPTNDIQIKHSCQHCKKENVLYKDGYSLDNAGFFLTMALGFLRKNDKIIIQSTDAYILIMDSVVNTLESVGIRVKKKYRTSFVNKEGKEIEITEIIMEKIGAIR